ncbi:hypothetical protein C8J57DRAFT_1233067 [Mycena rebaudengoi]|nr:hypothetical protein C8J57DRAFT_1233067 [Mycena rebaudengoi]
MNPNEIGPDPIRKYSNIARKISNPDFPDRSTRSLKTLYRRLETEAIKNTFHSSVPLYIGRNAGRRREKSDKLCAGKNDSTRHGGEGVKSGEQEAAILTVYGDETADRRRSEEGRVEAERKRFGAGHTMLMEAVNGWGAGVVRTEIGGMELWWERGGGWAEDRDRRYDGTDDDRKEGVVSACNADKRDKGRRGQRQGGVKWNWS